MGLFSFLNDQLLKMLWLSDLVRRFVENILGLSADSRLGGSVHFFLYDTIKIFMLLSLLIFVISWIQSYFPPERTRKILGGRKGLLANLMGALLGTLTPFCSCSSIPIFIGFTQAGLPIGITFSFLISSPLVDMAAFILLLSVFGARIAVTYVLVGVVLAVVGGTLIDRMRLEGQVAEFIRQTGAAEMDEPTMTSCERIRFARNQVREIVDRVSVYILIGVGIGATIHNWVPQAWIEAILGGRNPFSVVLATLVGVPMYADIFGTIPVAEALFEKGVGPGTIIAFMMAVTALSLPSLVMLSKVVKRKLLATFFGIVVGGILIIGYLFNAIAPFFG